MSDSTKYALAQSLHKILKTKPLDKVTISDLTDDCNVNRQTFYYHFHDIYELIEWIYLKEVDKAFDENRVYRTWQEGLEEVLNAMVNDEEFILQTYHSKSGGHLASIIMSELNQLLMNAITEVSAGYPISEKRKKFIADFYKYGYTGIIMQWVDTGMQEKPEEIVDNLECIMEGNILGAVKKYNQLERKGN